MSDLSLRPRSATELIDAAFRMYRQHFTGFITLSALVYLPAFALSLAINRLIPLAESMQQDAMLSILGLFVLLVCWLSIMEASLSIATSDRYLGREIEPGRVLRDALSRAGTVIAVKLWTWFVLFWAFLFFFFPWVYFFARYFAVPQTIVLEGLGFSAGLARTRQLAKGEKGKIIGSLFLIWLVLFAASFAMGILVAPDPGTSPSVIMQVLSSAVSMIVYPLVPITATLLYYDVRIRREGFDVEVLSAELEGPARVAGAVQG